MSLLIKKNLNQVSITIACLLLLLSVKTSGQAISGNPVVCPTGPASVYELELTGLCITPDWKLNPEIAGAINVEPGGNASIQFNGMSYGGIEEVILTATVVCQGPTGDGPIEEEPTGSEEYTFTKTITLAPQFTPVTESLTDPTISGTQDVDVASIHRYTLSRLGSGVQPSAYRWYLDNTFLGQTNGKSYDLNFGGTPPGQYELTCVPVNQCGLTNNLEMEHALTITISCETPLISGDNIRNVCLGDSEGFQLTNVEDPDNYEFVFDGGDQALSGPGEVVILYGTVGTYTVQAIPVDDASPCSGSNIVTVNVIDETSAVISGPSTVCKPDDQDETTRYNLSVNGSYSAITWFEKKYAEEGTLLDISEVPGTNGLAVDVKFLKITNPQRPARLKVIVNGCTTISEEFEITVVDQPQTPTCINCPPALCQSTAGFFEINSPNAEDIEWIVPDDVDITFPEPLNSKVAFLSSDIIGEKNISVRLVDGSCNSLPLNFSFEVEELLESKKIIFNQSNLNDLEEGFLYINNCRELNSSCTQVLSDLAIVGQLDVGELYDWGNSVDFSINTIFDIEGYDKDNERVFTYEVTFRINKDVPRQKFYKTITANLSKLRKVIVKPRIYQLESVPDTESIRSFFFLEETHQIDSRNAELQTVSPTDQSSITNNWNHKFSWQIKNENSCTSIPGYQFQLLKIYDDEEPVWSNALNIYTESDKTDLNLTIGEGDGHYIWRVRPVGSFEGGLSNPSNFHDNWVSASFNYSNLDGDKNWIYTRIFTEENKTNEHLIFADGLQQVKQDQTKVEGRVVGIQTLQDYAGRVALISLPIPLVGSQNNFGFKNGGFLSDEQPYSTADFDLNPYNPSLIVNPYYSGNDLSENQQQGIINSNVPDAEGFPYTRMIYQNDGTGRLREEGGVGGTHHVGNKSTKTFYTGVQEAEMVMLFGEEAPAAANVHKIVTIDANNTANVSFENKNGEVLATALNSGFGDSPFLPVDEEREDVPIYVEIDGVSQLGPFLLSTKKPIMFPFQRQVKVNYQITPSVISQADLCEDKCATCNYKIEIVLHRLDPDLGEDEFEILGSKNIPLDSICDGAIETLEVNEFTAKAQKQYVLEKRVFTDNSEFISRELSNYISDINDDLAAIQSRLNENDVEGLKSVLVSQFGCDLTSGYCEVPVGCETINIPIPDVCEEPPVSSNGCQFRDQETGNLYTFSRYLNLIGSRQEAGNQFSITDAVYFRNQLNGTEVAFTASEFDQMIANILTDYSDVFTCEDLWSYWQSEIETYEFWRTVDQGSLSEEVGNETIDFNYSLLDGFLGVLTNQLLSNKPSNIPEDELCILGQVPVNRYYFDRNVLYGRYNKGAGVVEEAPDLTRAYALIFYDRDNENTQEFLENLTGFADPSASQILALVPCLRYQIALVGGNLDQTVADATDEELVNARVNNVVTKCEEACQLKSEAFRQAIIDDIFQNDQNTIIEHYVVSSVVSFETDPNNPENEIEVITYVGSRDPDVNKSNFDFSECELDEMVNALVVNCQVGYCDLDIVFNEDGDIESVGTAEQIANYEKVFQFNFDVQVNDAGEGCIDGELESRGGDPALFYDFLWTIEVADGTFCRDTYQENHSFDSEGNIYFLFELDPRITVVLNNGIRLNDVNTVGAFAIAKFDKSGNYQWHQRYNLALASTFGAGSTVANPSAGEGSTTSSVQTSSSGNTLQLSEIGSDGISVSIGLTSDLTLSTGSTVSVEDENGIEVFQSLINRSRGGSPVGCRNPYYLGLNLRLSGNGQLQWMNVIEDQSLGFNEILSTDINNSTYRYVSTSNRSFQIEKRSSSGQISWLSDEIEIPIEFGDDFFSGNYFTNNSGEIFLAGVFDLQSAPVDLIVNGVVRGTMNNENYVVIKLNNQGRFDWFRMFPFDQLIPSTGFLKNNNNAILLQAEDNGRLKIIDIESDGTHSERQLTGLFDNVDLVVNSAVVNGDILSTVVKARFSPERVTARLDYNLTDGSYQEFLEIANTTAAPLDHSFDGINSNYYVLQYGPNATEIHGLPLPLGYYFVRNIDEEEPACAITKDLCFQWTTPIDFDINPDGDVVYDPDPITCEELEVEIVQASIDGQRSSLISSYSSVLERNYASSCSSPDNLNDKFSISYVDGLHHFTLYYYDRAGNLIKTVPPEGVSLLSVEDETSLATSRNQPTAHQMASEYQFNSLGQLISQVTPDGGTINFWYNNIGQLRFSQNEKQLEENNFSYTKYDYLGRIVEVGQGSDFNEEITLLHLNDLNFPEVGSQKTVSVFSKPSTIALPVGYAQRNLRNRLSYSYLDEDGRDETTEDRTVTIYSYDPHGNVEFLGQVIPGINETKMVEYDYDLISGNVKMVKYNPGQADQFYHRYKYDVDNRIVSVETSTNGHLWDRDASYNYYAHGPLKRILLGEDHVQSIDYIYTIHGWLKAINDPDDETESADIPSDAFAMALNYYSGDYVHSTKSYGTLNATAGRDLFNGNISAWEMSTLASNNEWTHTGYQYLYDELNRIRKSRFNIGRRIADQENLQFFDRRGFQSDFTLDGNGNIKKLKRFDIDALNFDAMTYHLQGGNNRLDYVYDSISDSELHNADVESQSPGNYDYDPIGNIVADQQSGISEINWTVYGKVNEVIKQTGEKTKFTYDAVGNRVKKNTIDDAGNILTTFYVRDGNGNVMTTYRSEEVAGKVAEPQVIEVPIYGSSRIGVYNPAGAFQSNQQTSVVLDADLVELLYKNVSYELNEGVKLTLTKGFTFHEGQDGTEFYVSGSNPGGDVEIADVYSRKLDLKQYELADHLGNVRTLVTDRKLSEFEGNTPGNFKPSIVSASAYYPFGMDMPTVRWDSVTVVATMEPENALTEIGEFENYGEVILSSDPFYNHTDNTSTTNSFVLNGLSGNIIGLSKSLKVQAGDKVSAIVYAKREASDQAVNTNVPAAFANEFLAALGQQNITDGGTVLSEWLGAMPTTLTLLPEESDTDPIINAGLSWMLFDNNYEFVTGGFNQLTAGAGASGFEELTLNDMVVPTDGFLLIYTTNESTKKTNVYFDDFSVVHEHLVSDDLHNADLVAYRYGFNGKEKDQKGEWGLNAYDYGFRIYNPALARFLSVDPLANNYAFYSPYQFAGSTPIEAIDLDGLEILNYKANIRLDKLTTGAIQSIYYGVDVKRLKYFEENDLSGGGGLVATVIHNTKDGIDQVQMRDEIYARGGTLTAGFSIYNDNRADFTPADRTAEKEIKFRNNNAPSRAAAIGWLIEKGLKLGFLLTDYYVNEERNLSVQEMQQQHIALVDAFTTVNDAIIGLQTKTPEVLQRWYDQSGGISPDQFRLDLTNYVFDGTVPDTDNISRIVTLIRAGNLLLDVYEKKDGHTGKLLLILGKKRIHGGDPLKDSRGGPRFESKTHLPSK